MNCSTKCEIKTFKEGFIRNLPLVLWLWSRMKPKPTFLNENDNLNSMCNTNIFFNLWRVNKNKNKLKHKNINYWIVTDQDEELNLQSNLLPMLICKHWKYRLCKGCTDQRFPLDFSTNYFLRLESGKAHHRLYYH